MIVEPTNQEILDEVVRLANRIKPQPEDFTLKQYRESLDKAGFGRMSTWAARSQLNALIEEGVLEKITFPGFGVTVYYRKVK